MRFTSVGRVHPERADVNFDRIILEPTSGGKIAIRCEASQLHVNADIPDVDDPITAFIAAKHIAQTIVSALGFALGTGYSVEMVQLIDEGGNSIVFGVRPGNLAFSPWLELFEATKNLIKKDFFFRFALQDYCQAMQSEIDCAFYCYRAIEAIKSAFHSNTCRDGWPAFHSALGTQRKEIDSVVKDYADPIRHGNWFEQKPTTASQRNAMLLLTRNILHKYLEYMKTESAPGSGV
jgi:hypothetical protein